MDLPTSSTWSSQAAAHPSFIRALRSSMSATKCKLACSPELGLWLGTSSWVESSWLLCSASPWKRKCESVVQPDGWDFRLKGIQMQKLAKNGAFSFRYLASFLVTIHSSTTQERKKKWDLFSLLAQQISNLHASVLKARCRSEKHNKSKLLQNEKSLGDGGRVVKKNDSWTWGS